MRSERIQQGFILSVQHQTRCYEHVHDDSRSSKVVLLSRLSTIKIVVAVKKMEITQIDGSSGCLFHFCIQLYSFESFFGVTIHFRIKDHSLKCYDENAESPQKSW